jgi:hypothetical protein
LGARNCSPGSSGRRLCGDGACLGQHPPQLPPSSLASQPFWFKQHIPEVRRAWFCWCVCSFVTLSLPLSRRYGALKTLGEKKTAFNEYVQVGAAPLLLPPSAFQALVQLRGCWFV